MSLLTVILLLICTCTYVRALVPSLLDNRLGKVGAHFGNVLGSGKERVHMWHSAAFSWPLAFYFGRKNVGVNNDKEKKFFVNNVQL